MSRCTLTPANVNPPASAPPKSMIASLGIGMQADSRIISTKIARYPWLPI